MQTILRSFSWRARAGIPESSGSSPGGLRKRFLKPAFVVGFMTGVDGPPRVRHGITSARWSAQPADDGLLDDGGGHAMAQFFNPSNRHDAFREYSGHGFPRARWVVVGGVSDLWLDALVSPGERRRNWQRNHGRAGPFGAANAEPVLAACDVRLAFADVVGRAICGPPARRDGCPA